MTLPTLSEIGEALYGPRWQSDLARDLKVSIRSVQRWGAGEWPVPDGVWDELRQIAKVRGAALREIAKRLKR